MMKARLINTSARGWGMITIVHDGISETRHCKPQGEHWQGRWLDMDDQALAIIEMRSKENARLLQRLGVGMAAFSMRHYCQYELGSEMTYHKQVQAEYARAKKIIQEQETAYDIALVEYERKQAQKKEAA